MTDTPSESSVSPPSSGTLTDYRRGRIMDANGHILAETTDAGVRLTSYGPTAAHLVGYLRTQDDVTSGVMGLELAYDEELRTAHNLHLSLDADLTRGVHDALSAYPEGAAVVVEVATGRILAMASYPSFEPGVRSAGVDHDAIDAVSLDPNTPLLNRALLPYFPGSTFTFVTTTAALEEHIITPTSVHTCGGSHPHDKRNFHCWKRDGHGELSVAQALAQSCAVFMFAAAEKLGQDTLARYAQRFGFGEPTGLRVEGKLGRGNVPTTAWYAEHGTHGFQSGMTLSDAVGQGDVKVTPLQLAMAYAALATGQLHQPILVDRIKDASGQTTFEATPGVRHSLGLSDTTREAVLSGLKAAVNDPSGTAYSKRLADIRVAGKTGTAQVVSQPRDTTKRKYQPHSWFAALAPADAPEIAVVVFLDNAGSGSQNAAPVAMQIIERYFQAP